MSQFFRKGFCMDQILNKKLMEKGLRTHTSNFACSTILKKQHEIEHDQILI